MAKPKTLQQAIIYFSNPDNCLKSWSSADGPVALSAPLGSKDVRFISTGHM
ncbi:MAG: hypothetical protein ACRD4X_17200 [Candidatus Acidiferrales bacterium]